MLNSPSTKSKTGKVSFGKRQRVESVMEGRWKKRLLVVLWNILINLI